MHEHFRPQSHSRERNYYRPSVRKQRFWAQFASTLDTDEASILKNAIRVSHESTRTAFGQFQKDPTKFIQEGKISQYGNLAKDLISFRSRRVEPTSRQPADADYLIGMLVFGKALDNGAKSLNAPGIKITKGSKKKLQDMLTSGYSFTDGSNSDITRMFQLQQADFINISYAMLAELKPLQVQSFLQGAGDLNFMFQESAKAAKTAKKASKNKVRK